MTNPLEKRSRKDNLIQEEGYKICNPEEADLIIIKDNKGNVLNVIGDGFGELKRLRK